MTSGHLLRAFAAQGMARSTERMQESMPIYADRKQEPRLNELRQGRGAVAWDLWMQAAVHDCQRCLDAAQPSIGHLHVSTTQVTNV